MFTYSQHGERGEVFLSLSSPVRQSVGKAVARLLSCGGRRQPYAPADRAGTRARIRRMSTGMLTSGASAGGQEKAVAKLAFRRQAVFYIVEHERDKTEVRDSGLCSRFVTSV
nr:MAG TPA: hypothetical protein [Caudoviricetes sp.]